jgi:hypothetical protein
MFSAAFFSFCNDNILLFAVSLAQVDITPDGKVTTSVSGVHSGIAARPARGIVSGVREKVADMLNAGMKPIQVESKLAEMDSVVRPLLSQIQALNKTLKKIYPNMDTLHAAMVALEPFIVDTPEKWATGLDDDLKVLGVVAHSRIVDGVEVVEPVIVFTSRAVAGNVLPAMEARGQFLPIRTDGTFRLTRMYVTLALAP